MLLWIVQRWLKNRMEAKWFLRMLFLELNISLHPLQNSFSPRRHKFSPGNSPIRSRGLVFFGYELPLSLYFPVLLLATRSLEIEALGTALKVLKGLEVLGVDVLEDDAIFDLRPEGLSRRAISVVAWGESQSLRYVQGVLESAGPYLTMGLSADLNIFQKQYRNKIQTKLFKNYYVLFLFSTLKSSGYASSAKLK